jgi:hypothetical protein
MPNTPGLYQHVGRPVTFSLDVDDFGIKYVGRENVKHLVDSLKQIYDVTTDWSGSKYCGLTIQWDYKNGTVDVSMPGYVSKALHRFDHPTPQKPQDAPSAWSPPNYGASA